VRDAKEQVRAEDARNKLFASIVEDVEDDASPKELFTVICFFLVSQQLPCCLDRLTVLTSVVAAQQGSTLPCEFE